MLCVDWTINGLDDQSCSTYTHHPFGCERGLCSAELRQSHQRIEFTSLFDPTPNNCVYSKSPSAVGPMGRTHPSFPHLFIQLKRSVNELNLVGGMTTSIHHSAAWSPWSTRNVFGLGSSVSKRSDHGSCQSWHAIDVIVSSHCLVMCRLSNIFDNYQMEILMPFLQKMPR